jgi:hypothetical protein
LVVQRSAIFKTLIMSSWTESEAISSPRTLRTFSRSLTWVKPSRQCIPLLHIPIRWALVQHQNYIHHSFHKPAWIRTLHFKGMQLPKTELSIIIC